MIKLAEITAAIGAYRLSGILNPLPKSESAFKFETFFHPFVDEYIKQLNRNGIPGLLNLDNQTLGNPYLHSPWNPGVFSPISNVASSSACFVEGGFAQNIQTRKPGNFEAVVLEGTKLVHYWRDNDSFVKSGSIKPWSLAAQISDHAASAGCIVARKAGQVVATDGTVTTPGNFEVCVLEKIGDNQFELAHYLHDNAKPTNPPWGRDSVISTSATGAGCITESEIAPSQYRMDAVVPEGNNLVHYSREANEGWNPDGAVITTNATGPGSILYSSFKRLEVVALEGNQLVHYWRDEAKKEWHRGSVITEQAASSGWITQSTVRDGQHGNFEVVVLETGNQLVHYWKDNSDPGSSWRRGQVITTHAAGTGCILQSSFQPTGEGKGNFEVLALEGTQLKEYWNTNEGAQGSASQRFYFANAYQPQHVDDPYPRQDVDFSYGGAYSLYNWEIFFHTPLLLATRLSQNQRFADAIRWFHFIFDPTDDSDDASTRRYWKVLPFRDTEKQRIEQMLDVLSDDTKIGSEERQKIENLIDDWAKHPFQPHRIARMRLSAYQKNVVMKYIDNLIAWGDQLFSRDTIEAINEATQLYILAADLLGPRPERIPQPVKTKPQTYAQLRPTLNKLSNTKSAAENEFVLSTAFSPAQATSETSSLLGIGDSFYFCIPQNDKLLGYWDTVADRLFKIRNCMNIAGIVRQLPLFEPPIDPALLVQAAAKGVDLGSVLSDLSAPLPYYRFSYTHPKAIEMCSELRSLGDALLSTIEKKNAEELAIKRADHEVQLLNFITDVKLQQLNEADASLTALQKSRDVAVERFMHYQALLGVQSPKAPDVSADDAGASLIALPGTLSQSAEGGLPLLAEEQGEMDSSHSARDWQVLASTAEISAGLFNSIPHFEAAAKPWGIGVGISYGGQFLAGISSALARYRQLLSAEDSYDASHSGKIAGYVRRQQEWVLQSNLAARDIIQINKQLIAANIRKDIADKELRNHQKQIDQSEEIREFLLNQKYTNEELYGWMQGELSALYFQCHQLASDLAKKAERCFRFELGVSDSNFIQFGYWDSLRKGLLAGERLYLALKQMERAYNDLNKREYEITKNVSLVLHDPRALIDLKETGTCMIELPEDLFDADYPGHYMRRLKSVSLTIPCVVGPYTSINCTLTLLSNKTRIKSTLQAGAYIENLDSEDGRFFTNFAAVQSIATSTAQNDSGLFELNFRDERYLPFEGAGVISHWRTDLPIDCNAFDFDTISDVILKLNYTAREGGDILRNAAKVAMQQVITDVEKAPLARLFSAKHEFPTEWYQFLHPADTAHPQTLTLGLSKERFPFQFRGKKLIITGVELFLDLKKEVKPGQDKTYTELYAANAPMKVTLTPPNGADHVQNPLTLNSSKSLLNGTPYALVDKLSTEVKSGNDAQWSLTANIVPIQDAIADLIIICHYSVVK